MLHGLKKSTRNILSADDDHKKALMRLFVYVAEYLAEPFGLMGQAYLMA